MSRRIEIELTSALDDGTFTWRAAGAKQPKGVVVNTVLPDGAKVGDQFKVEVEQTIDGIDITSVVQGRQRVEKAESIELLPSEKEFKPVVETRAPGRRRDGDGKPRRRRDRDGGDGDRGRSGDGRDGRGRDGRSGDGRGRDGRGGDGRGRDGRNDRHRGPRHAPPPEVPTRPKPKRLKPGRAHRNELLAQLPEEQRPVAELTLQGIPAVRQRLKEENEKAAAEGRPTMPEASVVQMAESLLPRLRVADWLDRAEAAQRQLATLDLRDLRSVVAGASDPAVARDESTRAIAAELKQALTAKQEEELVLWYGDIDASLAVGRVIRALRLSAQPPKAGVPFPVDIAERLTLSTNAALTPVERPDRWVATLEAAAFSPIHAQVTPLGRPEQVTDELVATVTRLAPALPLVAEVFGVAVDPDAPFPKPLRPDYAQRRKERKPGRSGDDSRAAGSTDQPKKRRNRDDSDGRESRDDRPRGERGGQSADDAAATSDTAATSDAATAPGTDASDSGSSGSGDSGSGDSGSGSSGSGSSGSGDSDSAGASDAAGSGGDVATDPADAKVAEEPVIDVDVVGGPDDAEVTKDAEAEIVAEAAVVAEAEAITEAATEVEAAGGSADDAEAIEETTTELLSTESDAERTEVDARVGQSDAGSNDTVDDAAADDAATDEAATVDAPAADD